MLYIGAGAVATGGIISLFRALPLIVSSFASAMRDLRQTDRSGRAAGKRTDRDLSLRVVGVGSLMLVLLIWATLSFGAFGPLSVGTSLVINLAAALLIVLFGFLFVTVSSRLTGEIGSSSNPISGMTVATLLLTCLIFLVLHWTSPTHQLIALSIAAIVCIASSNGGTTSQDLKTGYLVGATPKFQQYAILVGSISSALVIGVVLIALNRVNTVYTAKDLPKLAQPLDVSRPDLAAMEYAPDDTTPYHVWQALEGNDEKATAGQVPGGRQGPGQVPGRSGDHRLAQSSRRRHARAKARCTADDALCLHHQGHPHAETALDARAPGGGHRAGAGAQRRALAALRGRRLHSAFLLGADLRGWADALCCRPRGRKPDGRPPTEAESEMGPGVLLSTGYVAGGAIGAVLVTFLSFSDEIPRQLSAWQYRQTAIVEAKPLEQQYEDAAAAELGIKTPEAREQRKQAIEDMAGEIGEINEDRLPPYIRVPRGTELALPGQKTYKADKDTTLGEVAREVEGSLRRAALLQTLNADLKPPEQLPVGAEIALPQWNSPALILFSVLAGVLLAVGAGWWLRGDS